MDLRASVGVSLTGAELFSAADEITAWLRADDTPDLHVALGLVHFLTADLSAAEQHLRQAFLGFQDQRRPRRAALAAAHLGRLEHAGRANPMVAAGWFARATRLLDGQDDCVEQGWLALGILGCSVTSATELEQKATLALRLAQEFGDRDLECRALADWGLALVSQAKYTAGMRLIDEAMTMAHSGECTNLFVTGQVRCSFVSACQRAGDIARLEGWLARAVVDQPGVFGADARPNIMLAHCRTEYGTLLCMAGRWPEGEEALRASVEHGRGLQAQTYNDARSAFAALRLDQGRLAEAAALLDDLTAYPEAQLPIARLHLARGEHDLAVGVLRHALRAFTGDRARGAQLLSVLAEAESARGNATAARDAAEELRRYADESRQPNLAAAAALATARAARAEGEDAEAITALEGGLRDLHGGRDWPLLAAELHLVLAELLVDGQPGAAQVEAQRALAVLGPIGAARRFAAQDVLARCGVPADSRAPRPLNVLTEREREVLPLLAQGLSNPEIAEHLVISPKTAEHHVGSILRKLGLRRRSEAAAFAASALTAPRQDTARTP